MTEANTWIPTDEPPVGSRIQVRRFGPELISFVFPRFGIRTASVLCLAISLAALAAGWRDTAVFLGLVDEGEGAMSLRWGTHTFTFGAVALILTALFMLGRTQITLSREGLGKALRILGFRILNYEIPWWHIDRFAAASSLGSPIVHVHKVDEARPTDIEPFPSCEERDWFLRELNRYLGSIGVDDR